MTKEPDSPMSDEADNYSDKSTDSSGSTVVNVNESAIIVNKQKKSKLRKVGEEAWNSSGETLVTGWAEICVEKSVLHDKKAKRHKFFHSIFGLPSILLPVTMAALTPILDTLEDGVIIQVSGLVLIGLVSSVNTFYNFDKRAAKHGDYSARYNELATDVQYQLFKAREFRVSADEFIARVQTKFNNLNQGEP